MLASYKWLKELCAFEISPEEARTRFTALGLEVESAKEYGDLPHVVIAEVRKKRPHPEREKLNLVTVFDGDRELEVVCGAPNVPEAGKRVLFARIGAKLPNGMEIAERKLGGVVSRGMICSEIELDIGSEGDGILVVEDAVNAAPGTPAADALQLRDTIFEIGLTPNRPDCLGHMGLARELGAVLGAPLRLPHGAPPTRLARASVPPNTRPVALHLGEGLPVSGESPAVQLQVQDSARCPRYAACVVTDVKIAPSPFWLRYRLHVLGLRPINNVVDATNLVMLEYGYASHAFDLDALRGDRIEVRLARASETMVTLDGIKRDLSEDDLLICDGEGAVAIAGVMGGDRSGVQEQTSRVLVECAYFDPRGVRRTSRRLGLHTDASHRFERGVDPRAVPFVLSRVVGLLAEIANGVPSEHGFEIYSSPVQPKEVSLRVARVDALLGVRVPAGKPQQILQALGAEVEVLAGEVLRVRAPTWRPDLTLEEDLIEEVARVWGYDKIPSETPVVRSRSDGTQPLTRFIRRLKEHAAAIGLSEAVNYAFVAPKQLELARVSRDAVRMLNPLSEERSVMRTSVLPGLLSNVQRAQRHQVARVSLFEVARVFAPTNEALPAESYRLGLVLSGPRGDWIGEGDRFDFFDGKGMLESLLGALTRGHVETVADSEVGRRHAFLHPRRAARVLVHGREVGLLGELHPDVRDAHELSGTVVYGELDVAAVLAAAPSDRAMQVRSLPRFPSSTRDLSLLVAQETSAGFVANALRQAGGPLVEAVELFDLYEGAQLGAGKKSLAFRITYRDGEATLTDARVDAAHEKVLAEAQRRFAASVR
jgi:phenylalanyl-tRNA synthetase beta chain